MTSQLHTELEKILAERFAVAVENCDSYGKEKVGFIWLVGLGVVGGWISCCCLLLSLSLLLVGWLVG